MDTKDLLMTVKVTAADVTDRDAARESLPELRERNPELTMMWADNAYTGLTDWARNELGVRARPGYRTLDESSALGSAPTMMAATTSSTADSSGSPPSSPSNSR